MASSDAAQRELSMHRVPCGPMSIKASGICRRRLRDNFSVLIDRLSQETGPPESMGPEMPNGYHMMPDGTIMSDAHMKAEDMKKAEKKAKKESKNDPVGKLAEALTSAISPKEDKQSFGEGDKTQGNSRLLQRLDGKIEVR